MVTERWQSCSARAATAGSATTGCSAGQLICARAAADKGQLATLLWVSATRRASCGSPSTHRVSGSSRAASGANSGRMRLTGRPACSSRPTAALSQARSHTATHSGAPSWAPGSMAKCSSAVSSSRRSSSAPSSTARKRVAPPSPKKPRPRLPRGSSICCQDSRRSGTSATTSPAAGSSASGTCPALATWAPSNVST